MASLTIENVPDELLDRLRERATSHRHSLSQQALQVLERGLADMSPVETDAQVRAWERLAGRWQSNQSPDKEIGEIYAARSRGREVEL